MTATAIRVGLRDSDFEKDGSRWGWNKKSDLDEVVKHLKARGMAAKTEKPAKEKPAKAAKADKAEKPAKAKKAKKAKTEADA